MEVDCSFDEFAQVLAEDGYIHENSYFNDAADLPSMLRVFESKTVLDSPESFPESPCSDEDIARVLEITQMSSPSLLESCISDSFPGITTSQNDILDPNIVSMTKTKDPCITNAVLHDVFSNSTTSTTTNYSGRPTGSLDGFCLSSNIFNNSVSVNLNHLIGAKENDVLNTSYFDSTPVLSPLSDVDHSQPTPSQYLEQTNETSDRIVGESVTMGNVSVQGSFQANPEKVGTDYSQDERNDMSEPQATTSTQKRKRKRKSYSKASKSKKSKIKSSNLSPKPQNKPKKAKISDNTSFETPPSKKKQTKTKRAVLGKSNSGDQLVSADKEHETNDNATTSCQEEGTPLRRSSRSTRNTENYNFRTSSLVKRVETERRQVEPKKPKGKAKPPPLSKYRRRTANARERDRMKEINDAFDVLKESLPSVEDESKQKMTKFTVLKLTLNYISALKDMLGYPDSEAQFGDFSMFSGLIDEGSMESMESTDTNMAATSTYSESLKPNPQPSLNVESSPSFVSIVSNQGESISHDKSSTSIEYDAPDL